VRNGSKYLKTESLGTGIRNPTARNKTIDVISKEKDLKNSKNFPKKIG